MSTSTSVASSPSTWERLTTWASEHKAVVYTVGTVAVIVTAAGIVYYVNNPPPSEDPKTIKNREKRKNKEARKAKKEKDLEAARSNADSEKAAKPATVEAEVELPEIDEATIDKYTPDERKDFAQKLKLQGNKAYGSKDYNGAIDLYTKAIICKPDPVFFSNRAACWNALGEWDKVVDDCSAALAQDREYVKALNRRAHAYEKLNKFQEALLDYTASCIIDQFRNAQIAEGVERLLKLVAEEKGKQMLADRPKKLPSPSVVTNYFQSYRDRPAPVGLEETADLDEKSGKGQLQIGLKSLALKTSAGYDAAKEAFEKAIEVGDLGEHESFAYNMRGTFRYLNGDNDDALSDIQKSIELKKDFVQSYIKLASMHLELGERDAAEKDFENAVAQDKDDPDIYYHRAQMHFLLGDYAAAARDYQKSAELDKEYVFSHIQLGVTQYKNGSIPTSMATFRRTMRTFEKRPEVFNYYGELLLDQQKYAEAIEKFDQALELEKQTSSLALNVLPLINKALAVFQWKADYAEAENLCKRALILDPECEIAVATMAQLMLQQGKVTEALEYFEKAAELSRTEGEIVNALSYAEATRTQLEVQHRYPDLAARMSAVPRMAPPGPM